MKQVFILLFVCSIMGGGMWVDKQRQKERSTLSGFFENQPTSVSSRVTGRVARVAVKEGDSVKAGTVLVELEARPTQIDSRSTDASAQQAVQQYLEAAHGTRPEEIRRQEAVVAELTAVLAKLMNGSRPEEIAQARAAERNAHARYAVQLRGLTSEELAQLKARRDVAVAEEQVAVNDASRYDTLYKKTEVSRQTFDRKQTDARQATARRLDAEEAWLRARRGTPPQELEEARQAWLQALASLRLIEAGSRSEDIAAAVARLKQAQAQLDQLRNGNRPEDIAQRHAGAQFARARAESAQITLLEQTVRAPINGVVERVPVATGDLVNAGTTLVRMSDPADVWIRVYIPESHLTDVSLGDDADLALDGIDQRVMAGVESIATRGEYTPANLQSPEERGKQVFEVKLRLRKPDRRVKPGVLATVKKIGRWTP